MKNLLIFILFVFPIKYTYCQYIPMPSDSSSWRYRVNDIDGAIEHVNDLLLLFNGQDTIANGHTYHQVFSRSFITSGATYYNPPLVNVIANHADLYFCAIREDSQKVYQLNIGSESLIYDFTATVGSYIPAYTGTVRVTGIDSILLNDGLFHKRFLTTDTAYYVVEGAGSSLGLFPDFNDGSGTVVFYCFNHNTLRFSPDTSLPCTYVYPSNYAEAVTTPGAENIYITIYPVPVEDILYLKTRSICPLQVTITNPLGQVVWKGEVNQQLNLPVSAWAKGIYYLHLSDAISDSFFSKTIIIN